MDDLKAFQRAGADPLRRRAAAAARHLRDRRARQGDALLRRPVDQRHADRRADGRPHRRRRASTTSASAWTASAPRTTSFRRLDGAFDRSLAAVRLLRARGVKVGLRFTMTAMNAHDLPALLQLMRDEGVDKFYFSHLNYAGRGNIHRARDAQFAATRDALDLLFETRLAGARRPAATRTTSPATTTPTAPTCCSGCSSACRAGPTRCASGWSPGAATRRGVNVANIDNLGNVHPDTMWWHHDAGQRARAAVLGDLGGHLRPADGRPEGAAAAGRRAAAPAARTSTSAAATPACARSRSPATPGPRTRAATSTTTRSAVARRRPAASAQAVRLRGALTACA